MATRAKHFLLTGFPGCGKTTLVCRIIEHLRDLRLSGFYTQELRGGDGRRIGFQAIGLNGHSTTLASVRFKSRMRVGKYGVELPGFERLLDEELNRATGDVDLFVIDEIGKMECFSTRFVELVGRLLDSETPVLGTVALKGGGFISEVKQRRSTDVITVEAANRDALVEAIVNRLRAGISRHHA
jgi:nucleoside-triphosphatase